MGLQHAQKITVTYLNKYNMQSYTVPVKNLFFIQNYFWLLFNTHLLQHHPTDISGMMEMSQSTFTNTETLRSEQAWISHSFTH